MQSNRRWSRRAAFLPLLAVLAACSPSPSPQGAVASAGDNRFIPADAELLALLAFKRDQALWHDQQRLRQPCATADTCSPVLGPLVTLYALPALEELADSAAFLTEQLVGVLEVKDAPPPGMDPPLVRGPGRIYLRYVPASNTWTARLVQPGSAPVALNVFRYSYGTHPTPGAAQWDWDAAAHRHLIGIQCGRTGWCVLGTSATVTPLPPPECPEGVLDGGGQCAPCPDATGHVRPSTTAQCAIKGWYDRQVLALPRAPDGTWRLSTAEGIIVPVRGLGELDDADALREGPVAAIAWVSHNYASKHLSYESGKLYKFTTKLGNPEAARAQWRFHGKAGRHRMNGDRDLNWFQKLFYWGVPGSSIAWHRHAHNLPGTPVPGTARWNWSDDDENVWVRCGGGCCEDQV